MKFVFLFRCCLYLAKQSGFLKSRTQCHVDDNGSDGGKYGVDRFGFRLVGHYSVFDIQLYGAKISARVAFERENIISEAGEMDDLGTGMCRNNPVASPFFKC